mmetsp:Transcript_15858/g.47944  ORF Transcript_15858/g.47944 Transcript_15858/m.47944 type:complete len:316 (+) Transcript_15858:700-1647(+)
MAPRRLRTSLRGALPFESVWSAWMSWAVAPRVRSATISMLKSTRSRIVPWSITKTASSLKMCAMSSTDVATRAMAESRSSRNLASASMAAACSSVTMKSPGRRASSMSIALFSAPDVRKSREEDSGSAYFSSSSFFDTDGSRFLWKRKRRVRSDTFAAKFFFAFSWHRTAASESRCAGSNRDDFNTFSALRRCRRAVSAASLNSFSTECSSTNVTRFRCATSKRRSSHSACSQCTSTSRYATTQGGGGSVGTRRRACPSSGSGAVSKPSTTFSSVHCSSCLSATFALRLSRNTKLRSRDAIFSTSTKKKTRRRVE